jgi:hypothetical protein
MKKIGTHYEQVPLEIVKKLVEPESRGKTNERPSRAKSPVARRRTPRRSAKRTR